MKRHFAFVAIATITFFACNSEKKAEMADYAADDTVSADSTLTENGTEKMTKTADMRFRVKDVQQTKQKLSETLRKQGGLVMEFSINSAIKNTEKVKFSADSLKEITSYQTDGYMVARVPAEHLDELTNDIAGMAIFVDNQSLKMEDRSLSYIENRLKAENRQQAVVQINKVASKKSPNVKSALVIKDDYVDRKIQNLAIDQQVKYSTITLNFYQDHSVKSIIVANDNIYDYKPSFFRRLGLNLADGWMYFKELVLLLSKFWMFIVAGFTAFLVIRYYAKKQQAKVIIPPTGS